MAYPSHHRNGHRISKRLVTRPITHELSAIWDKRVIIGEALEPLALARS